MQKLLPTVGHADPSAEDMYVELRTVDGSSILMSGNHFIHVGYYGNLKPADSVVIGDTVFTVFGDKLKPTKVAEIAAVQKNGAYCPHTTGKKKQLSQYFGKIHKTKRCIVNLHLGVS